MTFTPSELIVLFPDSFTEEGGMLTRKVDLPDGRKLASERLGRAVVMAAILAVEAAGGLRLELQQGKALFGLMKTRRLMAQPGAGPTWPAGTLEAQVAAGVERGPAAVDEMVRRIIGSEQSDPAATLVTEVQRGMAARGLLVGEQEKVMKVFTVMRYATAEGIRAAADAEGIAATRSLLARAEAERAELWKELERAVRAAITFMTESSGD